jgi:hypothetical protein
VNADRPLLDLLDLALGGPQQLMTEPDQRPCRRHLLTDDRNVGVERIPLGASPSVEMLTADIEDDVSAGCLITLGEVDLDAPHVRHDHSFCADCYHASRATSSPCTSGTDQIAPPSTRDPEPFDLPC